MVSIGWAGAWWLLTLGFLIFKALYLPFPPAALPMEIVASFLILAVNIFAFLMGVRGNKSENVAAIAISALLLVISAVGAIYYMWLQTYVLMLDLAFSAIYLGINAFSAILALGAAHSASRLARAPVFKLEVDNAVANKKKR